MKFNYETQIDLHGLTVERALPKVEEVVYANENARIMIVHGKGNGVLRRSVREFLSTNPNVSEVEFGESINIPGGDGVTIAHTF